jgi:hypothetical protein
VIESRYWREELKREVRELRTRQKFRHWSAKRVVLFERKLMLVAFQVRTLLDRPKVNDRVKALELQAVSYEKYSDEPLTLLRSWPEEHFDLWSPQAVQLSVMDVCNQLIHHYWMSSDSREKGTFTSVMLCSDYKRHTCMYDFNIYRLIELFSAFSDEDSTVRGCDFVWNDKKQDYVMQNARGPKDGGPEVVRQFNRGAAPDSAA